MGQVEEEAVVLRQYLSTQRELVILSRILLLFLFVWLLVRQIVPVSRLRLFCLVVRSRLTISTIVPVNIARSLISQSALS